MSDKWQVQLQRRAQDQVGTQTPVRAHPDRADQSEEESQENCATYLKVSKIPCRIGRGYRMLQSRKVQALASFSQQRCVVDSKPRQFEHGINLEYNRMYNFLRQYFQSYRNGKYLQFGVFLDENSKHDIIANFGQSLTKEWLVLANHVALPKVQSELLGQQCKLYVVGQVDMDSCKILLVYPEMENLLRVQDVLFILVYVNSQRANVNFVQLQRQITMDNICIVPCQHNIEVNGYVGVLNNDSKILYNQESLKATG
eukprot:TRINITY_DN603_c1_g1_i3.p3 TRINITY_DN603_c1_g1~~TRINITY_DN603_c1_g1_i3.p3  ORF type:complete len:256 (+),score=-1.19 TRINITY_DN603_c1_g1_i3:155-922(+)